MIGCVRPTDVRVMYIRYVHVVTKIAKMFGVDLVCAAYSPGKDFELILMVKMETKHPIEGPFGCVYPAICNHCGVMMT